MADKLDTLIAFSGEAFSAENEAIDRLTTTSEKYLTAIGVILGFHVVEMKDLKFSGDGAAVACSYVVSLGVLLVLIALVAALWSIRVRSYPTYPRTEDLLALDDALIDDDTVKRSLIDVYLRLRDGIRQTNERRAGLIQLAGYLLTAGFLVFMIGQMFLRLK